MAVFKIVGTIIRTIERNGQRQDVVAENQYRLIRLAGVRPAMVDPEIFKNGMRRALTRAAISLGFQIDEALRTAFVCNDSDVTDQLPIPTKFNAADFD